jgi:hypothetical protein
LHSEIQTVCQTLPTDLCRMIGDYLVNEQVASVLNSA